MEWESWNFDYINFKTIQFDTLDEINLKGIISSKFQTDFSVKFKKKPKSDSKFLKKPVFSRKVQKTNNLVFGIHKIFKKEYKYDHPNY